MILGGCVGDIEGANDGGWVGALEGAYVSEIYRIFNYFSIMITYV